MTRERRLALKVLADAYPQAVRYGYLTQEPVPSAPRAALSRHHANWLLSCELIEERPAGSNSYRLTLAGVVFAQQLGYAVKPVNRVCRSWDCDRQADPKTGYCRQHEDEGPAA